MFSIIEISTKKQNNRQSKLDRSKHLKFKFDGKNQLEIEIQLKIKRPNASQTRARRVS